MSENLPNTVAHPSYNFKLSRFTTTLFHRPPIVGDYDAHIAYATKQVKEHSTVLVLVGVSHDCSL